MILYHPATDFYHCWMRFASILCKCEATSIEFDRIRIMDFFLCFPHELKNCKLPREYSSVIHSKIKPLPRTYEDPYSIKQGFLQIKNIHEQVARDMVAKGVVQREKYREGILKTAPDSSIPNLLELVAQNWHVRNEEWHEMVLKALLSIPLNGKDGLKDRSGLMEYRYDG